MHFEATSRSDIVQRNEKCVCMVILFNFFFFFLNEAVLFMKLQMADEDPGDQLNRADW